MSASSFRAGTMMLTRGRDDGHWSHSALEMSAMVGTPIAHSTMRVNHARASNRPQTHSMYPIFLAGPHRGRRPRHPNCWSEPHTVEQYRRRKRDRDHRGNEGDLQRVPIRHPTDQVRRGHITEQMKDEDIH